MAASGRPASFSTSASSSTKETPSRLASACPMVLLPAPRRPTSATTRRSVRSCWAEKSTSPAEEPRARATSWSRATEMFPCPPSRSARKRCETPLFCASSRRLNSRSSRRRRTAAPTEDSKTWCSRLINMHYTALKRSYASNIVLASVLPSGYLAGDGHARLRTEAAVRHPSFEVPPLDPRGRRRGRQAEHEGPAVRGRKQRARAEEQQLRPERRHRAGRRDPALALRAPRREVLRDHQRARQDLLRRRQHLHAGREHAPLQGQLLQVHERDAARDGGRLPEQRHPLPRRLQRRHRGGRVRAGAGLRRDRADRRRVLDRGAARGPAAW